MFALPSCNQNPDSKAKEKLVSPLSKEKLDFVWELKQAEFLFTRPKKFSCTSLQKCKGKQEFPLLKQDQSILHPFCFNCCDSEVFSGTKTLSASITACPATGQFGNRTIQHSSVRRTAGLEQCIHFLERYILFECYSTAPPEFVLC